MERVRITDVGPRDGLQAEPGVIPTARKVELVRALMKTGVDEVEVSSFVSPKWIPQLADAAEVFAAVAREKPRGMSFSALVPNEKGMAAALGVNDQAAAAGGRLLIDKVAVFTAASETFCQKNINASIAESVARFKPVVKLAHDGGLQVRGYVSCAIACPFEGEIAPAKVAQVAQLLLDIGCDEIDLGDTIGAAEPATINALLNEVLNRLGESRKGDDGASGTLLTLHLHDTHGTAAECVREALQMGVHSFDGAAGGLGGCPYAKTDEGRRAPGNISTGSLVSAVEDAGYHTGIDTAALQRAEALARSIVAEANPGGPPLRGSAESSPSPGRDAAP